MPTDAGAQESELEAEDYDNAASTLPRNAKPQPERFPKVGHRWPSAPAPTGKVRESCVTSSASSSKKKSVGRSPYADRDQGSKEFQTGPSLSGAIVGLYPFGFPHHINFVSGRR